MQPALEALIRGAASDPRVIGLGGGLPAVEQFPRAPLAAAFLRVVTRRDAPGLQYGWPEGSPGLRRRIAEGLRRRGAEVGEDDVIVTNGAQQAIALAVDLLCKRGDRLAVDAETYPAALALFRDRGLQAAVGLAGARAAYLMPAVGNPRSRGLGADDRQRLLAARTPLIEDDAYAELRFAGPAPRPLLADARTRVFHVGTFSKTLCPGLRVGWLVPPPRYHQRALRLKHASDLQASSLGQEIVDEYLARADFDRRLQRLRRFYRMRAHALQKAIRRHLPGWHCDDPEGAFGLWLVADRDVDEGELLRAAIQSGVSFDPGSTFRADGARTPLAMRLCHSFVPAPQLDEGVRRLAAAWRRVSRPARRRSRDRALPATGARAPGSRAG